ncbi:MAG: hypothetical protein DRJ38_07045 [Thermoprotei archaeon]|nr:MAG: hypothetical protein DRJ38_07045 [Thermoprotei archaeon]
MIEECYQKAVELLKRNSTKYGFTASSVYYRGIWARDSCITILGACLTEDEELLETSRKTLETLRKLQTRLGQIPNNFIFSEMKASWGRGGCTDASLWYVIASWRYFKSTEDRSFLEKHISSILLAMNWLLHQDQNNTGLIDSVEGADWMDSTILRSGKLLYNNTLWYKTLQCANELLEAREEKSVYNHEKVKSLVNALFWPIDGGEEAIGLTSRSWVLAYRDAVKPDRKFYLSHVSCEKFVDICDTLANCLTIIFDIADDAKKEKILNYFEERKLSTPYPIRVLDPPVTEKFCIWRRELEKYRKPYHRSNPYCYHNAGIWPYVGGFYILALVKTNRREKALKELRKLAEANKIGKEIKWEFNEWLHGQTGKPSGQILQTWNAGMYICAYKSVKEDIQIL